MSTTDTWAKLAQPEIRAKEIAESMTLADITVGTEAQIKYARDLRNQFIADVLDIRNDNPVRWAVIEQVERGKDLTSCATSRTDLDYSRLANDAWARRTLTAVNTNDAKTIIDWFASIDGKTRKNNAINTYIFVIRNPSKSAFDGKKWVCK